MMWLYLWSCDAALLWSCNQLHTYISKLVPMWMDPDTVAVQHFIESLQPCMKVNVKCAKLVTLHEAIYKADSTESVYLESFQKCQQGQSLKSHNQACTMVSNSIQALGSGVQGCTDGTGNFYSSGPMELSSFINVLQGVQR